VLVAEPGTTIIPTYGPPYEDQLDRTQHRNDSTILLGGKPLTLSVAVEQSSEERRPRIHLGWFRHSTGQNARSAVAGIENARPHRHLVEIHNTGEHVAREQKVPWVRVAMDDLSGERADLVEFVHHLARLALDSSGIREEGVRESRTCNSGKHMVLDVRGGVLLSSDLVLRTITQSCVQP
jgi:hypothetical protein